MNELELALASKIKNDLESYLSDVSKENFRKHVEEIKQKAACTTEAGVIKRKLQDLLDSI